MFLIFVGLATIAVTVALHAWATSVLIRWLTRRAPRLVDFKKGHRAILLGGMAVFFGLKHYIDMVLWALVFWQFAGEDDFGQLETAIYFSSVTYTSLGYGDVVLNSKWRHICGIEAMNGIILFGWTTALLFIVVQKLWAEEHEAVKG